MAHGRSARGAAAMSTADNTVTVHGNIAEAALRGRREAELILYLIAVELKTSSGANGIMRRRLVRTAFEWGIFSRSYARQLLRQGNHGFWRLGARTAFLIGDRGVAALLGAGSNGRYRQRISIRDLVRGPSKRRGMIFSAAIPNDRPVSQIVLCRLTRVSIRSQHRYREMGCFKTTRQDADLTSLFDVDASWSWLAASAEEHRSKGVYIAGDKVMKRLPNLHCAHGERIPGGQRAKDIFRGLQPLDTGQGCQSLRVWFPSRPSWRKSRAAKLGVEGGEVYVDPETGLNLAYVQVGPGKWEAVAMLAGQ